MDERPVDLGALTAAQREHGAGFALLFASSVERVDLRVLRRRTA